MFGQGVPGRDGSFLLAFPKTLFFKKTKEMCLVNMSPRIENAITGEKSLLILTNGVLSVWIGHKVISPRYTRKDQGSDHAHFEGADCGGLPVQVKGK